MKEARFNVSISSSRILLVQKNALSLFVESSDNLPVGSSDVIVTGSSVAIILGLKELS